MNPFAPNPTLIVAAGPPGCGKTRYCLQRFLDRPEDVVLVFPTTSHMEAAKAALRAAEGYSDIHEFHLDSVQEWSRFVGTAVDLARGKPFLPASRSIRLAAAATVAREARYGYFAHVSHTLGFQRRLADIAEELTAAGLTPPMLREAGERAQVSDRRFADKCHSLAELWERYDAVLDELRMRGPAAAVSAACDAVLSKGGLPLPEIWLDGFSTLTQVQIELLAALAEHSRVGLTLAVSPGCQDLFAGSDLLLQRLGERFELVRVELPQHQSRPRSRTMQCLAQSLFADRVDEPGWDEQVLLISCPNRLSEVEMAARYVVFLMNDKALAPKDLQVIARDLASYWPLLETVWPRFGLTPSRSVERPIASNRFVQFLLATLSLFATGWQREDVLKHVESSYAFGAEERRRLRSALADHRGAGRDRWRTSAEELRAAGVQGAERLADLARWAERFERARTPAGFVDLTRTMATEMGWAASAAAGPSSADDDFAATTAAYRAGEALEGVSKVRGEGRRHLGSFLRQWEALCRLVPYRTTAKQGIRVTDGAEDLCSGARVVILLGVLEGVFPRRFSEDPFLSDEERLELRRITGCYLVTGRERAVDERRRFYLAATHASDTLLAFFPRTEDESESLPSLYLDDIRRCLPEGAVRDVTVACGVSPLGGPTQLAPSEEFALTREDLLLCAALQGSRESPFDEWVALPAFPRIESPEAAMLAGRRPGPVSVTELEALSQCPFQHWARHRARLDGISGTFSRAATGSLLHEVLRDAMRHSDGGDLADALSAELEQRLSEIHLDVPEWEVLVLHALCHRLLSDLATREAAYRRNARVRPAFLEWRFGEPESPDTATRQRDPRSTSKPLRVEVGDGKYVDLAGSIDRVDADPESKTMLVLDYKLGSGGGQRVRAIENGQSVQLPLYALAVQNLLGASAVSIGYECLGGGERIVQTSPSQREVWLPMKDAACKVQAWPETQWQAILQAAKAKVGELVAVMERAEVAPTPGQDRCHTCPYGDLCRTKGERRHDGAPYPEDADA